MIEKGFLIYANNTWKENYLKQAYALALSIKLYNNDAHITVVTNTEAEDKYNKVFDNVIVKKTKPNSLLNAEERINAFDISPYLKTIVMDADVLVTENLNSWWKYLKNYMIYYASSVRTYRDKISDSTAYRKTFVENELPNLYNTFSYFEKSEEAALFYRMQRLVVENWQTFYKKYAPKKQQKWCSMDVSSAITAKLLCNEEQITSKDSFINVVHLKPKQQGWTFKYQKASTAVTLNFSDKNFYIGNFKQNGIIHYVENHFLSDYLITQLEEANATVPRI